METINDVLQKQLEKCNKIIEQAEKNKNMKELSNSKVAEIQQQIEELHNKCNAELQRQEDLKQEIHTISQQICVDFKKPELTEDNAALRIQKYFSVFLLKYFRFTKRYPEKIMVGL